MIGTLAAVCECAIVRILADFRRFGRVAEWFKAAVLKTAYREHRYPAQNSQTRRNPERIKRVLRPFAKNVLTQESAHMAWRYQPEKFEAMRRANREQREREAVEQMDAMPREMGLCYFVGSIEDRIVKIGYSTRLHGRVSQIKGASGPYRLKLLASINGGYDREQYYHSRFAAHRFSGEWLHLVPEIQAEIDRINSTLARLQSERGPTTMTVGGSHG